MIELVRLAILFLLVAAAAWAQTPSAEHFERHVRPVLAQRCYACHGPDKQFSGLRVDSRAALFDGGKRGAVVVPGSPESSLLLRAIRHEPGLTPMPSGAGKLSAPEIAAIEQWIKQGAEWPASTAKPTEAGGLPAWYDRAAKTHWSFQPVKPATPPPGSAPHPVDRFLRAALAAKGLAPARPAEALTVIRRASFVLTGLPTTPAEIEAFTQDRAPGAFDRAVDRLIASPHFGEHWARHWMDVVRYGETRGYEWNYEIVGAWRYRDYLIRAFNADVPYNQFVREHIAGDLLEKPRLHPANGLNESVIATAFFRLGEAGHDDCIKFREISLDVVDNQIDTLGKAFQGLTLSCARCHDHKLDPIPTADYYGLFGVLNSSRAQTHTIDAPTAIPAELAARKRAVRNELAGAWTAQIASLELRSSTGKTSFDHPLFPWLAMRPTDTAVFAATWRALAARYREESQERAQFNREHFTPYLDWSAWSQDGLGLRNAAGVARAGDVAIATEGAQALTAILPAGLHTNLYTDRWNGALRSPLLPKTHKYLSVRLMGGRLASCRTVLDNCAIGDGYRVLENDSPRWHRLDTYSREKLPAFAEIVTKRDNPRIPDRPRQIKATEAEIAAPGSYFGATSAVLHDKPESPREELGHLARLFEGETPTSLEELIQRYRAVLRNAIAAWAADRATDDDVRWLDAALRAGLLENSVGPALAAYRELEARLPEPRTIDGMGDAGAGFDTPILRAGDPHAPGEVTPRHFLSRIGNHAPALNSPGSGRRELAESIADPANPLTARLMVNRVWHHVFGRGLVPTVDNFGREGERPSHPQLLDYLATRFVQEGWSVKKLARLLATSEAFRQSSEGPAPEADPANALLHHYPARRLAAESIRDSMLATSGALNRTLHGPSIAPPRNEPQAYRRLFAGPLDGQGRRSLYTQVTRMEGSRFLEIFDYPNPMAARGARDITNVPAQALAMMNDPFVHEQARVWAERLAAQGDAQQPEARVDAMFRAALGRPATAAERARFAGLAAELASLHRAPVNSAAVWKDVAHALFNLKEFLYLR